MPQSTEYLSYEEWELGKHKIPKDELFDPLYSDVIIGFELIPDSLGDIPIPRYQIVGYKGRITGIKVGLWFSDIAEYL